MNRKCLISGAALLCAAVWQPSALAQGSVSLDSCRRMALSNNKTIRMAEETISGAGYDRKAAKAAYLPGIDFTAAYAYNQHGIHFCPRMPCSRPNRSIRAPDRSNGTYSPILSAIL